LLDAKNLLQTKVYRRKKIQANISIEQATRMKNGYLFASFRFEAKNFFNQNRRTLEE
jgi:hypothetical protein